MPVMLGSEVGRAIRAHADNREGAELLRASVADAVAAGAFGSPFVLIDGEPFWGVDRLAVADDWLSRGGW